MERTLATLPLTRRSLLGAAAAVCVRPGVAAERDAPLRVIVPFAAGGPSDVVLRAVGERWRHATGAPLVVEHRAGASGTIGAAAVARAEADGSTLLFAPADVLVNNTAIFRELPYDPLRDFAPVALLASVPLVLAVPASLPAPDLRAFAAWARKRRIGYGSWGLGSHSHLAGEALLVRRLQLDATHAAYRGLGPMLQDLIGAQLHAAFGVPPVVAPQAEAGRLRVLAVTGERRSRVFPAAPTLRELGYADAVLGLRQWAAFVAPAATPAVQLTRLQHELGAALADPRTQQALADAGFEIGRVLLADDAAALLRAELAWVPPLIRALGVPLQ
jgi:tripartite-type tricarboxylate transporter receptor subunit TctC